MRERALRVVTLLVFGATLAGLLVASSVAPAAASPNTDAGVSWLRDRQETDGGFELADFPGFETPDAVYAIAAAGQGLQWDVCVARAAVTGVAVSGRSGLDALDDLAEQQGDDVGIAAKLVVLATLPLGLDPRDFDPSKDSDGPVDLVATILAAQRPDGQFKVGALNATAFSVMALHDAQGVVSAASLNFLDATQTADGSWHYAGASSGGDVDTTALVLQALLAVGRTSTDPVIARGFTFLARAQNPDGSWSSYGSPDPNSTAIALMALRAGGFDTSDRAWRDQTAPERTGSGYGAPAAFLASQQQPDGRIASPNDVWGVNTFATSQSVQALAGAVIPVNAPLGPTSCSSAPAPDIASPTPDAPDAPAPGPAVAATPPGGAEAGTANANAESGTRSDAQVVPVAEDPAPSDPEVSGTSVSVPRPPSAARIGGVDRQAATGAGVRWGITIVVGVLLGLLGGGATLLARRRARVHL